MTLDQLIKAELALFAQREGSGTGSLNICKAIAYTLRNRVKGGWHGGTWIDVLNHVEDSAAHEKRELQPIDLGDRNLQAMLREVEEIYLGDDTDETCHVVGNCLYYQFVDRPVKTWFVESIVRDPENHPRRGHVGSLILYE